jgi:hypothetical protein
MNTENINNLPSLFRKFLQRFLKVPLLQQRKFLTFLFFVILSTAFWFVRALSEKYETTVSYPVRYENFPENKVLIGKVPNKLTLMVRANGFSILKSRLNLNLLPIKFNVNSFSINSMGADTFFVVTETIKDILSSELKNMTILDIDPDTLFFRFTDMMVKKVAVIPVLARHDKFFRQEYMLNGEIEVIPDSIIISGPGNLVRGINQVTTVPLDFNNLMDTTRAECGIKHINNINLSQQKVKVIIPVDRFTEVEQSLSVIPVNVPDSLNMIAIPGQVTVTFRICLSNYQKIINNPSLMPRVDYMQIQENHKSRLTVFLPDTPRIINNLQFSPKETEFFITRK